MTTAYHISANDLTVDFIKSVKTLFKNKNLFITIADEMDETEYLLASESNHKILTKRINDVKAGLNLTKVHLKDL